MPWKKKKKRGHATKKRGWVPGGGEKEGFQSEITEP